VTVRLTAHGDHTMDGVHVEGATLSHAIRTAARRLGFAASRAISTARTADGYLVTWGDERIHISGVTWDRKRPKLVLTVSQDAHDRLRAMADDRAEPMSRIVERLIMESKT
jgi:hypothetical protein